MSLVQALLGTVYDSVNRVSCYIMNNLLGLFTAYEIRKICWFIYSWEIGSALK